MDQIIALLKEINIAQIVIIFFGGWFFYKRLDSKIEKMDAKFEKMDAKFEKIDAKFEKLHEKIDDIDKRLCRIEGGLASHGSCLFNQSNHERKVL